MHLKVLWEVGLQRRIKMHVVSYHEGHHTLEMHKGINEKGNGKMCCLRLPLEVHVKEDVLSPTWVCRFQVGETP